MTHNILLTGTCHLLPLTLQKYTIEASPYLRASWHRNLVLMAFLTDPWSLLFCSILFVAEYVRLVTWNRVIEPNPSVRLMIAHNHLQVLMSLTILSLALVTTLPISSPSLILDIIRADNAFLARLVYHYSKIYEYWDIFLVVRQGNEVGVHFFFHHFTTPWFTMARVINSSEGWQLFAGLNAFHHTLSEFYILVLFCKDESVTNADSVRLLCWCKLD
jgi:hypothetical protein